MVQGEAWPWPAMTPRKMNIITMAISLNIKIVAPMLHDAQIGQMAGNVKFFNRWRRCYNNVYQQDTVVHTTVYYLRRERDLDFVYGILYSYYALFLLKWVRPYAFLTLRDGRWLTR